MAWVLGEEGFREAGPRLACDLNPKLMLWLRRAVATGRGGAGMEDVMVLGVVRRVFGCG